MAFGMKKRGGGQGGFIDKRHESSVNGCDSAIVVVPVLSESSFHVFFQKFNFNHKNQKAELRVNYTVRLRVCEYQLWLNASEYRRVRRLSVFLDRCGDSFWVSNLHLKGYGFICKVYSQR